MSILSEKVLNIFFGRWEYYLISNKIMFVYLWIKEQSRQAVIAHKPANSAYYVSGFLVICCPPDKWEIIANIP